MKRTLAGVLGLSLASLSFGAASALGQGTGIINSVHNFATGSGSSFGQNSDQVCVFCHTPHNATSNNVPLWNRAFTLSSFTMYSSPTLNGTMSTAPGQVSIACLSCHDGTIAVSSWGTNTGGTDRVTGADSLGTNLGDDHPIGLDATVYPGVDAGIKVSSSWNLPLYGSTPGTQLECATCHDPHNGGGHNSLLRADNAGSALCLRCHNK